MSFPGMVHFLFIDRSFDELTSPSLPADGQVVRNISHLWLSGYNSWCVLFCSRQAISYVQKIARRMGESPPIFLRRKVSPSYFILEVDLGGNLFCAQIWSMVQRVQKYLALGYTLQTWLDDDFLYTYFLWINIPNNTSIGVRASHEDLPLSCGSHAIPCFNHVCRHLFGFTLPTMLNRLKTRHQVSLALHSSGTVILQH